MPTYMGIDESNHGNFPEIFTAVFSDSYKEIIYGGHNLSKLRHSSGKYQLKVENILRDTNFNFSVFPNQYREFQSYFSVVFLYEALKRVRPDEVIFDGSDGIIFRNLEKLQRDLYNNHNRYKPKIIIEEKADISYPLVNKADALSYYLFHIYRSAKPSRKVKHKRRMVSSKIWTPDFVQVRQTLDLKLK